MTAPKSFLTVKQLSARYPAFTEGSIRWAIFNRDRNGFTPVICRIGQKIVLDEAKFVEWVERGAASDQGEKAA